MTDAEARLFSRQAQLFDMHQQVCRVGVDPESPSTLKFFAAVAPREHSDSQRALATCSEKIPDAIANYDAIADWHVQSLRRRANTSGEGLALSTSSPVKTGIPDGNLSRFRSSEVWMAAACSCDRNANCSLGKMFE